MPYVTTNKIRLHYEERGSGDPLILIMGLGAPGSLWEEHVTSYEQYFRCFVIDNRGAGKSDQPMGSYSTNIMCSFHPNSPMGSLFRDAGDYKVLLNGLNSNVVGFAPDTGHIAKGGMNVIQIFMEYRELIKHIHFKDISAVGEWTGMGEGIIDFP